MYLFPIIVILVSTQYLEMKKYERIKLVKVRTQFV